MGPTSSSSSASRPSARSGVAVRPRRNGARREPRGERVRRAGQVMALVEDDEAEARAEVLHVQVRGVVGRDGERLDVVIAAADDADRHAEGRAQEVVPLPHEVERRRDDERAAPHGVDRQDRDVRLAGAGRQHDDAAPACALATPSSASVWNGRGSRCTRAPGGELGVAPRVVDRRRWRPRGAQRPPRRRRSPAHGSRPRARPTRAAKGPAAARGASRGARSFRRGRRATRPRAWSTTRASGRSELLHAEAAPQRQDERDEDQRVARDRARAAALHLVARGRLLVERLGRGLGLDRLRRGAVLVVASQRSCEELELLPVLDLPQSHESDDEELSSSSSLSSQPEEELEDEELEEEELEEEELDEDDRRSSTTRTWSSWSCCRSCRRPFRCSTGRRCRSTTWCRHIPRRPRAPPRRCPRR